MVGRGRKWDFTGRKITFLIYCATQTGREGPELTPCASQLSLRAAWGWGHKQGAKGSRVMVHDGPKVPLVNGKVRHRSTKSISWSARREHEAGWLTRGNGGGCNANVLCSKGESGPIEGTWTSRNCTHVRILSSTQTSLRNSDNLIICARISTFWRNETWWKNWFSLIARLPCNLVSSMIFPHNLHFKVFGANHWEEINWFCKEIESCET